MYMFSLYVCTCVHTHVCIHLILVERERCMACVYMFSLGGSLGFGGFKVWVRGFCGILGVFQSFEGPLALGASLKHAVGGGFRV